MDQFINIENIDQAYERLKGIVTHTPCKKSSSLSQKYKCNVYLKREDLQVVRSYKIRGAYNFIKSRSEDELSRGVVCASAGNHAQGVAYSCRILNIKGKIFMPNTTPGQKIRQVRMHGGPNIEIELIGDTFDDAFNAAQTYCDEHDMVFVHPFDNSKVVEGQATVGVEILSDLDVPIDYLFVPVGGGGFAAGVGYYMSKFSPETQIIGSEPLGAPAMFEAIKQGKVITLESIDKFVDGAAVKKVGELPFSICKELFGEILLVDEGQICSTIISMYNEQAIVAEPAGALSIAALEQYKEQIVGKNVVCIVSGGNNDLARMSEIQERSLLFEGLKYYFILQFPQRSGALREFLDEVLGPEDDITRFEYVKKSIKESGPALVGIELKHRNDYKALIQRMEKKGFSYKVINNDPSLFTYFV